MANSKRKCTVCKVYFPVEELRSLGATMICGDCKPAPRRATPKPPKALKRSRLDPALRKTVNERDGKVCRYCSKKAYRMECHHIAYRSQGGPDEVSNLIMLCDEHHELVHSNKRLYQPTLRAVIWAHYVEGRFYTVPQMLARLQRLELV